MARGVERAVTPDRLGCRMHHPSLGLPPDDVNRRSARSGSAACARTASASRALRCRRRALAPGFDERYDETQLRLFLRDIDRHIEQLARALETGEDAYVVSYGEWLVPIYRRRHVPMRDFMAMLDGLRHACAAVLSPKRTRRRRRSSSVGTTS